MKQIINKRGDVIPDLVRNDDGSISSTAKSAYIKNKTQHEKINSLQNEVNELRQQINLILNNLNKG